ncbi:tripartite tricarboxylate transporter substrate-binding protein [Cupriavidus sp. YR651]|uniref:tripartite tricarboxylate transporter substrate-binding protein n=1 Tax=Cupriavidus sp. YR651 TaxID=1855315 RepID=UPI002100E6AD|nr:tripartite tricarboxylate transporter substrate-binding protein [Cupriavidus sp. YR651]
MSPLSSAYARGYPARPVTVIVPFAPGGVVDKTARQIQDGVSQRLGRSVVIENHGGAGGTIGSGIVARCAADGYTSQRLAEDGFEVVAGGPDQMNALVGMDMARWAQVVLRRAIPLQ